MITATLDIGPAIIALREQQARLRDLSPAWRSVSAYVRRQTVQQFDSQGGRSGAQWQPLTPGYERRKERAFPGQPILRASDRLFRSLAAEGSENINLIEPQRLIYGTSTPYARYHQRGGKRLPKRQILAVTETDRRQIAALVREHLANQAKLNGFRRA